MKSTVVTFINENSDLIDNNEWEELFDEIYDNLDNEEAEECVNALKETLDLDIIKNIQLVKFYEKFDDETDKWRFTSVEISHILDAYNNFYGFSYSDARQELIENPEISWEYKNGGYILPAEVT